MSSHPRDHAHGHDHDDAHDHAHDHADGHAHEHGHAHVDEPGRASGGNGDDHRPLHGKFTAREAHQAKRLAIVLAIITLFFGLELAGAIAARSVVLQADALHLLMDVLALSMSLLAMRIAVRRPTPRFTFGMRRAEPVAAMFNAFLVLGVTVEIVTEGIAELHGSNEPRPGIMLLVASGALVVNGVSAWLLHGAIHTDHDHFAHPEHTHGTHSHGAHAHGHAGHHDAPVPSADGGAKKKGGHTLNLRGAWLHLLGDALGSIAALVAAVALKMGGPVSVDAIASFVVAAILVAAAYRLIREALLVFLEAAPPHLPVGDVRAVIVAFPGVAEVHDLHVWTLGAGHDAITAHVRSASPDAMLARRLSKALREAFVTEYVTVQVETREQECAAEDAEDEK